MSNLHQPKNGINNTNENNKKGNRFSVFFPYESQSCNVCFANLI